MSSITDGQIGPETKYDLALEDGKVVMRVDYKGANTEAVLEVKQEVDSFLEKLKSMIPGQIDDYIIDGLRKHLK